MKKNDYRKRLAGLILAILMPAAVSAFPRGEAHRGTATTTSSNYSPSFNPSAWCLTNRSTTIDIYTRFAFPNQTGSQVANTANDTANIVVYAGTSKCWRSNDQNVTNSFTLAVITASSTADYQMEFFRGK